MGGIFGILFLIFIFIRAIGGSIRDGYQNAYLKNYSLAKGYNTWMDAHGHTRDIVTNHKTPYLFDSKLGLHREDIQTGMIYTDEIDMVMEKFHKAKRQPHEGTVWRSRIARKPVYIDYDTEEIYQVVSVDPKWENGKLLKESCYFYTDFWTNTEVIRKTDWQLEKDKEKKRIYTLEEIRNYPGGNHVRDEYGKWRTTDDLHLI